MLLLTVCNCDETAEFHVGGTFITNNTETLPLINLSLGSSSTPVSTWYQLGTFVCQKPHTCQPIVFVQPCMN